MVEQYIQIIVFSTYKILSLQIIMHLLVVQYIMLTNTYTKIIIFLKKIFLVITKPRYMVMTLDHIQLILK
jgi:hypothetical protein